MKRLILAGICGGTALNITMLLTFRLLGFGWNGKGVLLDPQLQSEKLIAVWTSLEPLPLVVASPLPVIIGLFLFATIHAFVYKWLSQAWTPGLVPRAFMFAGLLFFMTFLFWEFFTPFNLFGEPLSLILLELLFWSVIALAEAFAIAAVFESRQ